METTLPLTEDRVREIYEEERVNKSLASLIANYPEIIIHTVRQLQDDHRDSPLEIDTLESYAAIAQEVIDSRPSLFKTIKGWFK